MTMSEDNVIHLNVPHYRQTKNYTCVPSCCKMILDYANQFILTESEPDKDEADIAKIMNTTITGTRKVLEERLPLARVGEPVDVANAVLYLASDEANWVTGTILNVDGGKTAS